jgi:hypothetical protein
MIKYLHILILLILSSSVSYAKYKVYECDIKNNIFNDTRICKSRFIAINNKYLGSQIYVNINQKNNLIELFVDKKNNLRSDISFSIFKNKYNILTLGYENFIFEFTKGKNKNIDITNMSLGYEFSYDKFDLHFYSSYSVGIGKYELDIAKDSYFMSSKLGVKKDILGINLGIFGFFSKDFIDDFEINVMSFGVSVGL